MVQGFQVGVARQNRDRNLGYLAPQRSDEGNELVSSIPSLLPPFSPTPQLLLLLQLLLIVLLCSILNGLTIAKMIVLFKLVSVFCHCY